MKFSSFFLLLLSSTIIIHAEDGFTINSAKLYLAEKAWSVNTGGPSCHNYYGMTINNRLFSGNRPWGLRWDTIKDAFDYSNKNVLELGCCMGLVATSLKKYRNVNKSVAMDGTDKFLVSQGSPQRIQAAKWLAQAFEADVDFIQVDLNADPRYEQKIGFDYDIVFCLSLLHWVKDKERFLRYLSNFDHVMFEGHDSDATEISRFKRHGFNNYTILGRPDKGRTVIHFYK